MISLPVDLRQPPAFNQEAIFARSPNTRNRGPKPKAISPRPTILLKPVNLPRRFHFTLIPLRMGYSRPTLQLLSGIPSVS